MPPTHLVVLSSNWCKPLSQFCSVEDFSCAELLAGELLDTYITGGIQLAWMMVTRIPPMIATEPTSFDPHCTILEECNESNIASQQVISLRPILYFSYEGEVAVQGIVTTLCSSNGFRRKDSVNHDNHRDTGKRDGEYQDFMTVRVCNSHIVAIPAIRTV